MFRDEIGWAFIGAVTLAYIAQRHNAPEHKVKLPPAPSAQLEVDPTRWRHDGTQQLVNRDGNQAPNDETFKTERSLFEMLAF